MISRRLAPLLGLVATFLVALGACSTAFAYRPDGWPWSPVQVVGELLTRPVAGVLILGGLLLLTWVWWLIRPRPGGLGPSPWLVFWWSLPLLVVPSVMSGDPFLYADAGWIVRSGLSPYQVPLAGAGGPFAAGVDAFWAGHGVAYPPLTLLTNWLGIEVGGLHPYWGVIGQRVFALLGVALIAYFLPRLAVLVQVSPERAVWLGLLNPYVVMHAIGGAHNDALMAGVVVLALWLAAGGGRWRRVWLAPVAVGVAMSLKQQAGLAVIAVAGLPILTELGRVTLGKRLSLLAGRTVWATLVAVATFIGISLASGFGFGWTKWIGNMGRAFSMSPAYLVGDALSGLVGVLGLDSAWCFPVVMTLGSLAWLLLACWALIRFAAVPLAAVGWASLCVAFVGQAVHPWYLLLGLVVLSVAGLGVSAERWLVAGVLGFLFAVAAQFLFWWWWPLAVGLGAVVGVFWFRMSRR